MVQTDAESLRLQRLHLALRKALDSAVSAALHFDTAPIILDTFDDDEKELLRALSPEKIDNKDSQKPHHFGNVAEDIYLHALHNLRKRIEQDVLVICEERRIAEHLIEFGKKLEEAERRRIIRSADSNLHSNGNSGTKYTNHGEAADKSIGIAADKGVLFRDPLHCIRRERETVLKQDKEELIKRIDLLREDNMRRERILAQEGKDALTRVEEYKKISESMQSWVHQQLQICSIDFEM